MKVGCVSVCSTCCSKSAPTSSPWFIGSIAFRSASLCAVLKSSARRRSGSLMSLSESPGTASRIASAIGIRFQPLPKSSSWPW